MRTLNSLKNLLASWVGQLVLVVCKFISRAIFVRYLSIDYLGVNGLFSNILIILSFADLGIGICASHYLYKPLAEDEKEHVVAIVHFFRKLYQLIGLIVLGASVCMLPFLDSLIGETSISEIKLIFMLHVINSCVSYFNAHKKTLLSADQKAYVAQYYEILVKMIQTIVGIVVIIEFQNYVLFYLLEVIATLIVNVIIARKTDKLYPFLRDEKMLIDISEEKRQIKSGIFSVAIHKFATVVVHGTDNILITKLDGLTTVGYYSNYTNVTSNVNNFVGKIFSSMSAGIGNFSALESVERRMSLLHSLTMIQAWVYGFCGICLYVLLNPFVTLWLGEDFLIGMPVVAVIVANYYIQGMRYIILFYRDAEGLFKQDRMKAVIEAILNLGISIVLGMRFGIFGVLFGTTISMLVTVVWMEPYVVFKYGLGKSVAGFWNYMFRYVIYATQFVAGLGCSAWICSFIENSIVGFILKLLVCLVVPNVVYFLCNFRSKEFGWVVGKVKSVLGGHKRKA